MTSYNHQKAQEMQLHHHQHQHHRSEPWAHQVVKAATAATAGGSLLLLSSLTLVATVISLTVATPLLVIFSPVILPALITVSLIAIGFLTSGGFGVAAATVFTWMYRFVTGGDRTGDEEWSDRMRRDVGSVGSMGSIGSKGRARDEHGRGHHATGGVRLTTGARAGLYNQS